MWFSLRVEVVLRGLNKSRLISNTDHTINTRLYSYHILLHLYSVFVPKHHLLHCAFLECCTNSLNHPLLLYTVKNKKLTRNWGHEQTCSHQRTAVSLECYLYDSQHIFFKYASKTIMYEWAHLVPLDWNLRQLKRCLLFSIWYPF